jgi:hypothetical protein
VIAVANATRPKRPTPTHECPGGCGAQVAKRLLACGSCWWLLPQLKRDEIRSLASGSDRMAHLGAVGDALIWFRENVKDGEFVGD